MSSYLATWTDPGRPPHPFTARDDGHARRMARQWSGLAGVWRRDGNLYRPAAAPEEARRLDPHDLAPADLMDSLTRD